MLRRFKRDKNDKEERNVKPRTFVLNGKVFLIDEEVYKYIEQLQNKEFELSKVRHELEAVKPIVKSNKYRQAISIDCGDCKYVVRSPYSKDIIGCCKDNVCEDFTRRD